MQECDIKNILENKLQSATVIVTGADCNFTLTVISNEFESLSTLKRQKIIYNIIGPLIQNGSLHAVTMNTYTPKEWQNLKQK